MTAFAAASAAILYRAAREAMARKDAREARHALARLVTAYPDYAPGWLSASVLELDLQQPGRALAASERALALGNPEPALLVQRIRCLHATGQSASARAELASAERAVSTHPHLLHELGNACAAMGEQEDALRLMASAATKLPNDPSLAYNMAAVLRYLGRFPEAEACLNRAIRHAPQDMEAYLARSQLRTQTAENHHLDELKTVLSGPMPNWSGEVQIRYALAKELEDVEQFAESFVHLHAGATLRRKHLRYDVAEDIAAMGRIREHFDARYLASAQPSATESGAIFVFGLPRSGTTLVDRILSSHPQVTSLGELNEFPASVIACAGGPSIPKQALIARAARGRAADIGNAYLSRLRTHPSKTPRFIDKLPMNYLYAGLIAAAFPDARLIHVRRHPMANAYGMFKTLFNQGYPFSYDLDELARYIAAYLRLMSHWRQLLGQRLVAIDYEALVTDQETQTKSLLVACGLPWHAACLAPHHNAAPSSTQSAVQVRHPIYAGAVNHWRHFEQELALVKTRLIAEGVSID